MEVWGWSRRGQRFNTACSRAGKQWRMPNTEKILITIKVGYGAIGSSTQNDHRKEVKWPFLEKRKRRGEGLETAACLN